MMQCASWTQVASILYAGSALAYIVVVKNWLYIGSALAEQQLLQPSPLPAHRDVWVAMVTNYDNV